ncbi:DUF1657 domain-containing protein [Tissierellaceae bacterium BX21]|uniref:DUF1657 domain-containing protein n=2 Tax=Paratissierella segnis TaxID=2763679 RepID=A0A926EZT8_9FIRM|nr:DUF1657 domain-containing protein [Paratissierella segnis]
MTVVNKLESALASAKSLSGDLKSFSLDTDNQEAKQMFGMLSTNADNMVNMIESRINTLKNEEPQYNQEQ